jgi:mannose-6-phosphate isomerase-like protein (cupin superfamily)
MKYWLALSTALLLAASGSSVIAGGVPLGVHYIGHEKVAAEMVKGGRILEENGLIVIANRGVMRGAEIHEKTNHVFIIVDGEADFVTGGKMIEPKEISPGQIRGDVITIPAKTPHWWKDTSKTGSVGYYAVNIEQD